MPQTDPISITRFERPDKEALYTFLQRIWPERSSAQLDRRWWWWATDLPPLLLARDSDGRVVGTCGFLPFRAWDQRRERTGAWIVDYFVLPELQGKGIGKRFVAEANRRFEFLASLHQTDAAWAAFKRSGWRERSFVPLFLSPSARLTAILARVGSPASIQVAVTEPKFGTEFDDLWRSVRDRIAPAGIRDAATLSRRLATPVRPYVLIRGEVDGVLRGYMVVRTMPPGSIRSFARHPMLLVVDYLFDPDHPALFRRMLRQAAIHASSHGVRFVLCMAAQPGEQRTLARAGFVSRATPIVGGRLSKLDVGFTATPDAPQPEPWHLTPLDCDIDLLFDNTRE